MNTLRESWAMCDFWKDVRMSTFSFITILFTFVPESAFDLFSWSRFIPSIIPAVNIVINRIIVLTVCFIIVSIMNCIRYLCRRRYVINDDTCCIEVTYGDILEQKDCKIVIPFDECFSTHVGPNPEDINENSICGQYLKRYPITNMQALIMSRKIKPESSKSEYGCLERYLSGTLVPRDNFLLMSFAHLDSNGSGFISCDDYLKCLSKLWKEIDKYYSQNDVCIPILGSGVTRFNGAELTQQELLDKIIASYKLSCYKIKKPSKLRIICKKTDGFSLNRIGNTVKTK